MFFFVLDIWWGLNLWKRQTLSARLQIRWGKFCLVFCKAAFGFILLKAPQPNLFLRECPISRSGVVCSSCSCSTGPLLCPLWIKPTSFILLPRTLSMFYMTSESFPSWIFFFFWGGPHFESRDCFTWENVEISWNCGTVGRCQFLEKKSSSLDVIFLLSIVCVILIALMMFYQW